MTDSQGIDYFSRGSRFRSIATRVAYRARKAMYACIASEIALDASTTVLDVGLTPDTSLPDSNFFERHHPHGERIIGLSPEPIATLARVFPTVKLVQASGTELPVRSGAVDVAVSFAVIEHVGTRDRQRQLVSEMLRVADAAVITTPNRWFPVELHTFLPLLHWLPRSAHRTVLRRLGMTFWAQEANLHLLSRTELADLVPADCRGTLLPFRLLGMRSNLVMVIRRKSAGYP